MDEKKEQYQFDSQALADRLQGMLEAVAGEKANRWVDGSSLDIQITINKPAVSVIIKPEYSGRSILAKRLTGDSYLLVNIAGNKTKHPRRKDGTYNLDVIVERFKVNAEHHLRYEKAQKEFEIRQAENERSKAEELAGIEIPKGVEVERYAESGDYAVKVQFQVNGLSALGVQDLLEALKPFLSPVVKA